MTSQDYRVSTIAILCKDCNNDVGMYPGLHKCPPRPAMPEMPSIPAKYQQQPSSYSTSASRTNGRRPPDLESDSLYSGGGGGGGANSYGGGSRTPTSSSSYQDRIGGGSSSRTPTATSFQERMRERDREKQQREREEREAAARAVHTRLDTATPSSTATPAAGAGTTIWSRLRAAKDVINATITGEERWPDSDDSDHEGESHVCRILREYTDKKEERELAAKIAELEMTPVDAPSSLSRATGASRNQYLRDDAGGRKESPSTISSTSSGDREDHYGKSLRARGEPSGGSDPSERSWSPSMSSSSTNTSSSSYGSNNLNVNSSSGGSRYRSTSDVSRDDALSRLEGKSQGDKLAAQVSHLGSTSPRARANSPNGHRPQDQPTSPNYPSKQYQQYSNHGQLSPSSAGGYSNNNYSPSSSQRSASPSARRYDSPSPSGPPASSSRRPRYGGQESVSPTYPNNNSSSNNYRPQPGQPPSSRGGDPYSSRSRGPDPGQGYGRPEYDRRPPVGGGGVPASNNNLGAYGQRQQQQHHQKQQYQQQHSGYGSHGNYF
ncbi:hypothetical protein BGX26_007822 [Mortierella sp. AD094]|nr:hypothetical protein BGX26_007822 [Mortierella sp. AD094]